MNISLKGKRALIGGSSRGLGLAVAKQLAYSGASVTLMSRNENKLKGIGTKKNEVFGIFRRGGFSSKIKFIDHFFEEIKIRLDNNQNKFLILVIFIYKYLKNFSKI